MSQMTPYFEGSVARDEIDNLGHMNMQFYGIKAAIATHRIIDALGLGAAVLEEMKACVLIPESHTRFYNEQLEGAPLVVQGGVLSADRDGITFYLEMLNSDSGEVATTHVNVVRLYDLPTRTPIAFNEDTVSRAGKLTVDWPERGQPRSLPLDPLPTDLTLAELQRRGVVPRTDAYTVRPQDCDEFGFMNLRQGQNITFAKRPRVQGKGGVPVYEQPGGQTLGLATLESRQILLAVPRLGDVIQTYSVNLLIERKTQKFGHWTFDIKTGKLLSMMRQLNLAFDIAARGSVAFPPAMRADLESNYHPDLA